MCPRYGGKPRRFLGVAGCPWWVRAVRGWVRCWVSGWCAWPGQGAVPSVPWSGWSACRAADGPVGCRWFWRRCGGGEAGAGCAAPTAGFGRQAGCGAAGGGGLAGVEGGQDALVAEGQQAGEPEHEGSRAHQPGPEAGGVVAGGVLGGGEGPLGAGAPGVGPPLCLGGVVLFLPGFGGHVRRDGDRLLLA